MIFPVDALLLIPAIAIPILALVSNYRLGAALNVIASGASLAAGIALLFSERTRSDLIIVDDFNIYLITLTTLVGFTTSIFSASYIGHEIETGRLTPAFLRFYHAMYQALLGAMNVALLANNIGLMWVGVEVATLSTVMMVGIYRTPEAIEAAWKYFILGSVGIALAFFGTVLVYLAAQDLLGEGLPAMAWDLLVKGAPQFRPAASLARLRVFAGRLRHQDRARAVPRLAARRARGRTDADLRGAVGVAAQRRALRTAALQDGACRQPRDARRRRHHDHARDRQPGIRRVHAVPAARHQAAVCLFVDRAHGHRGLRLRHRRPAGELRRPDADDRAFAYQIGDFLRGRPHRAGEGDSAHRRHGRAVGDPSGARRRLWARGDRDCGASAVRRIHQRVHLALLDLRSHAGACRAADARHPGLVRGVAAAPARHRVRRSQRSRPAR